MAAQAHGVIASVVHTGTTRAEARGAVTSVVWRDRDTDRSEPKSFLLFQDAQLRGGAALLTATSQEGAYCGTTYAQEGNEGDLIPYSSGEWNTAQVTQQPSPTDLELLLVRTGGLYNSAEYAWRFDFDGADQYRGSEDLRWLHDTHMPLTPSVTQTSHHCIGYSRAFNRVVVGFHPTSSTDLRYGYQNKSSADPKSWTTAAESPITFNPDRGPSLLNCPYSSMVELPDGSMRWAYAYDVSGTDIDIDILGSTDGGVTWEVIKEKVVTELYGSPQQIVWMKMVASGDWLRLDMHSADVSTQGLVSAWSSDRCATWQLVEGHEDGDGIDDTAGNGDSQDKYQLHDLCAVDDAGTFMRVRAVTDSAHLRFELASRDGSWSQINSTALGVFSAPDTQAANIWLASGGGRVYVLVFRTDHHGTPAGASYWSLASFIIPLDRLTSGWNSSDSPRINDWARWGGNDWLGYRGVARYHPRNGVLMWVGDRLAFYRGTVNRETGTSNSAWNKPCMSYFGGTTRRSLRLDQNTHTDLMGDFLSYSWDSSLGVPDQGGSDTSAYTPWVSSFGGSPSIDWSPERMAVTLNSASIDWGVSVSLASTTQYLADAGVVGFSTRAQEDTVPDTAYPPPVFTQTNLGNPNWGCHVRSESNNTAGLTLDISVHIDGSAGTFAFYDCASLLTLYESPASALAGITTGTWYDFRIGVGHSDTLGIAGSPALYVEVAYAKAGDYPWVSSGLITLGTGAALVSSVQAVTFGHSTSPGSSSTFEWREMWFNRSQTLGNCNFDNPDTLRGFDCVPYAQLLAQAIEVTWGGGGGFKGDVYEVPVSYQYGCDQLFTDSPNSYWLSTSATTQNIDLDATRVSGYSLARFVHAGVAVVNTNSRYVQLHYCDDSNFASDVATIYVDGLRYTTFVSSDEGNGGYSSLKVTGGDLGGWQDGELVGHYVRAEPSGSVPNPTIMKISDNRGSWLVFSGLTQDLSDYGIAPGTTLYIWGQQHMHAFNDWPAGLRVISDTPPSTAEVDAAFPRYMRVTVPSGDVQGNPPEGAWRIGRLQAGATLGVDVPLAWNTLRDTEEPAVDLQQMASGVRTAYQAGPPRRTIKGKSEGDVDEWRVAFRAMVRNLAAYSVYPVVLCMDDLQQHRQGLYSRFVDATEHDDAGWRWNPDRGRWDKIGDLALTFDEEV